MRLASSAQGNKPVKQDRRVALRNGQLREQAQRCWRLARSIYNAEAAAELEAYARQLEERAERLETKLMPERPAAS